MISLCREVGDIDVPLFTGELKMIPFNLKTLEGVPDKFKELVKNITSHLNNKNGQAFLTIHGKQLNKNQTLRRPGPHTDGNYEPYKMTFGNGWKVGENGPPVGSELHKRQYTADKGGIILCTNYSSSLGYQGEFSDMPSVGGDCSHIKLTKPFKLLAGKIYYGNNHFIHESLPVDKDIHRVMVRITLPEQHTYETH